jgi:hypothetical protein
MLGGAVDQKVILSLVSPRSPFKPGTELHSL